MPVVGVDGWARIVNEHPQFDGMTFDMPADGSSCTCVIFRKDRGHPISVTEYMSECKRGTQPWQSHPRRMLRHKAMIQCARMAFGFAGIYDPDEAERIRVDMGEVEEVGRKPAGIAKVREALKPPAPTGEVIDNTTGEISQAPPPAPPAQPARSYAQFADAIQKASSADAAALELDSARDVLPEDQLTELGAVYASKWSA